MNTLTLSETRIYVACLASYNSGRLHGKWIDANQDEETINEEIQQMLKESPEPFAEEWAIHDYDGFGGLCLSEYESIEDIVRHAEMINKHGEAYIAYAGNIGSDYVTEEGFEEAYQGQWDSEEDFAEHIVEETMEIPEHIRFYFDYEKYARELFMGDYYSIRDDEHKVRVFRNI